jgi:hypothetical protein
VARSTFKRRLWEEKISEKHVLNLSSEAGSYYFVIALSKSIKVN